MREYYVIEYCGKKLISAPKRLVDQFYGNGENWADAYTSESGLDMEFGYCPSNIEIVLDKR